MAAQDEGVSMALFRRGKEKSRTPDAASAYSPAPVRAADLTVGDYANGLPNIRIGEMIASFFRQMVWVFPLALIGAVGAFHLTKDMKRTYTGEGTVMVQLGDEYVYQPVAGTNAQSSLMQTPDTITLNEVALMKNDRVIDDVIAQIKDLPGGLRAFAPKIATDMARHSEGTTAYRQEYMKLRRMMNMSYHVSTRPKSSVVDMSFKHEDPDLAVSTLNRLMDSYMTYRRTIFVDGTGDVIAERRADTEQRLRQVDREIAAFLDKNQISDFTSEQAGARTRTEDLRAALNGLRAQIVELERSLASVEDQLRATPDTINLYIDDRASNRIAQAELELKQLLAKYLPNSDPVRQKQLEIDELRSLTAGQGDRITGGRRVGPNPVYQALLTQRNTVQATANSLREKEITMQQQLNSADGKLRRMAGIEPRLNALLRERETLTLRLTTYLGKEQEALLNQQQAEAASENVKVISKSTFPIKGRNMSALGFVGATAAWVFTLLMFALFRVFADPRLYAVPATTTRNPQTGPYASRNLANEGFSPMSANYHSADYHNAGYAVPQSGHPTSGQPEAWQPPAQPYAPDPYAYDAGQPMPAAPYPASAQLYEGQFHQPAPVQQAYVDPAYAYPDPNAYAGQDPYAGQDTYTATDPYAAHGPDGTIPANPYLTGTRG